MTVLSIPVDAPDAARSSALDDARKLYRWYQDYLHPIPTLFNAKLGDTDATSSALPAAVPAASPKKSFHETLLSEREQAALAELLDAHAGGSEEELGKAIAEHPVFAISGAVGAVESLFGSSGYDGQTGVPSAEVPGRIPGSDFLSVPYRIQRGAFTFFNGRVSEGLRQSQPEPRGPADYQQLYDAYLADSEKALRFGAKVLGFEGFADLYASDSFFAWQRVAGTNPRALMALSAERLPALLAKMPLTDAQIQAVAGPSATVKGEAEAGRLFYCDYWLLTRVEVQVGRYLAPAIGVFWSDVQAGELRPVAIQLQQAPGRIYLPAEAEWPSARALFQIADFNYHEMGPHLSEGHFGQEAFVVAARRNLSAQHPIGALLGELYWGLLYNNALGRLQLVNPGGYADQMMAGDLEKGSLTLVRAYYTEVWRWDDWDLDRYLARQGTGDTAALPVYPYRDDALPLWGAIKTFAAAYVAAWYERDAVVANDRELGAFVSELVNPAMGNLGTKGFPASVLTCDALSAVLARLIWQASAGHGGINYSQYQYFAPIANSAGAAYASFAGTGTLPGLMDLLPPISQAISQNDIINVLTQKVFGSLGVYSADFLDSLGPRPAAKQAVSDFQQALQACSAGVAQRNATPVRVKRQYPFLDPGKLPNSTNI